MLSPRDFYNTIIKSSHPLVVLFHLIGKTLPILVYIFGSLFLSYTARFILTILLIAFDFYVTKNICGRILVQLRWWYDNKGHNGNMFPFIFESYKQYPNHGDLVRNPIDVKIFWWSFYLTSVIWSLLTFLCFFSFEFLQLLLTLVAVFLTNYNIYGFHLCNRWEPNAGDKAISSTLLSNFFPTDNIMNLDLSKLKTLFSF